MSVGAITDHPAYRQVSASVQDWVRYMSPPGGQPCLCGRAAQGYHETVCPVQVAQNHRRVARAYLDQVAQLVGRLGPGSWRAAEYLAGHYGPNQLAEWDTNTLRARAREADTHHGPCAAMVCPCEAAVCPGT